VRLHELAELTREGRIKQVVVIYASDGVVYVETNMQDENEALAVVRSALRVMGYNLGVENL